MDDLIPASKMQDEVPETTTQYWATLRHLGTGPVYTKVGPRRVYYRRSDLEKWAAGQPFHPHRSAGDRQRSAALKQRAVPAWERLFLNVHPAQERSSKMSLSQSSYAGEAAPLSERQARELDKKARAASDRVATNVNALLDLLGQAQTGSIHVALGCSWRTWFKDAVRITSADGVDRKTLVRAIANTLRGAS